MEKTNATRELGKMTGAELYQNLSEDLRKLKMKLKMNMEQAVPEQRKEYKNFLSFRQKIASEASELLKVEAFAGMEFRKDTGRSPEAGEQLNEFLAHANQIIEEEAEEIKRISSVLFKEMSVEPFLTAAHQKLIPRIWDEAYAAYWQKQCQWVPERSTFWNPLIRMWWQPDAGMWLSEDGTSGTMMFPPVKVVEKVIAA